MQTPTKKGRIFMEKKPHLMAIVLFLTGLICIGLLFGLSYKPTGRSMPLTRKWPP